MLVLARALTYSTLFVGLLLVFLPARVLSWSGIVRPAVGVLQVVALVVGAAGATLAVWCVMNFVVVGRGTPAPFDPPRRLVVKGPYRAVRNPIYLGAGLALAAAALFYQSLVLLAYTALFLLATHFLVIWYEEPTLRRMFGPDYESYCRRVSRWWPSLISVVLLVALSGFVTLRSAQTRRTQDTGTCSSGPLALVADSVAAVFDTHQFVFIGSTHGGTQSHDFLLCLMSRPGFQRRVTDVLVEWANPVHQTLVDRFLLRLDPVPDDSLRRVWFDTDAPELWARLPLMPQFYAAVRAINTGLEPTRRIRVLGGCEPIDWSTVRTTSEMGGRPRLNSISRIEASAFAASTAARNEPGPASFELVTRTPPEWLRWNAGSDGASGASWEASEQAAMPTTATRAHSVSGFIQRLL